MPRPSLGGDPGKGWGLAVTSESVLVLAAAALLVGCLIGSVGIGGVLLPPALAYLGGLDIHLAMATSMFSFLFTGTVGTVSYSRKRSVDWRAVRWLAVGVTPAAVLGARSNASLSANTLTTVLAIIVIGSGLNALRTPPSPSAQPRVLGSWSLLGIGAIVGFGSALSGTGGPILLVPALLAMGVLPLTAIAASQVVQVPVAASATAGYLLYGRVDLALGAICGAVGMLGVVAGASLAHRLPALVLRRIVAWALIVAGLLIVVLRLG